MHTREQAADAARYYAWGRQDGAREASDSTAADAFAEVFATTWQTYRDEHAFYMTNLETAYDNWVDHGHPYGAEECGGCGRRHTPECGKPERCEKCTARATALAATSPTTGG